MAGEFLGRCSIACRFDVADDLPDLPLGPELRHNLFLVAREAVNNVAKHSGASVAKINARLKRSGTRNKRSFALVVSTSTTAPASRRSFAMK